MGVVWASLYSSCSESSLLVSFCSTSECSVEVLCLDGEGSGVRSPEFMDSSSEVKH